MNKAILFIVLLAVTNATMPGGWNNFKFNSGFQSDSSSPLTKVYNKLTSELKEQGIENIQFISAQSQIVNGMNFKVEFSYTQEGVSKTGHCFSYVSFSGETCEINEVELQKEKLAASYGGWQNYPIKSGYEQDPKDPLNLVYTELQKELSEMNVKFVKFQNIQSQVVAGIKLNIQFQYMKTNGDVQVGTCMAVVRSWEKFVEIEELSVKSLSSSIVGGYSNYEIEANFQSNPNSPLNIAYLELAKNLKNQGIELIKFNKAQSQVVNGINFKINFTYKLEGKEMTGDCKVYVNFTEKKAELMDLQISKTEMLSSVRGGWSNFDFNMNQLTNASLPITFAYNKLVAALQMKGMKLFAINDVQSQVVSGTNFKIGFIYREKSTLKIGSATIYVQPWTNTVEISQFELQGQSIDF